MVTRDRILEATAYLSDTKSKIKDSINAKITDPDASKIEGEGRDGTRFRDYSNFIDSLSAGDEYKDIFQDIYEALIDRGVTDITPDDYDGFAAAILELKKKDLDLHITDSLSTLQSIKLLVPNLDVKIGLTDNVYTSSYDNNQSDFTESLSGLTNIALQQPPQLSIVLGFSDNVTTTLE